jgi:hypothetical protein
MKISLIATAFALATFTYPAAAADGDVTCAEWLAYRNGDTSKQGQAPALASFIQGYLDAMNEYSDTLILNRVPDNPPANNFIPPQASFENTASVLDRVCRTQGDTENAVTIGLEDIHSEMKRRAEPIIRLMIDTKRKIEAMRAAPPQPCSPNQSLECHEIQRRVCSGAVCHVETVQECTPMINSIMRNMQQRGEERTDPPGWQRRGQDCTRGPGNYLVCRSN